MLRQDVFGITKTVPRNTGNLRHGATGPGEIYYRRSPRVVERKIADFRLDLCLAKTGLETVQRPRRSLRREADVVVRPFTFP